jgi:hypothetical protein
VKQKAWPDSLYSDDLLYLGSRAKAFIFDLPKTAYFKSKAIIIDVFVYESKASKAAFFDDWFLKLKMIKIVFL